ncbi:fluoride efflux transporter FluC [Streptomyces nanshensis]|uniref:Fluoride-specific ion channel n=1 Tax=Streptomyces nanshensis TaxID=518642 RepID=A0A1E7KVL3_9ACTN|nr:CrcB family protein [Streptomyces nanshensis]OEV07962.1 hypothetical protein AN218_28150 [Streptomyces nanshensis]
MPLLLVCLGGIAGAVVRRLIERAVVGGRDEAPARWAAFAVNFGGCFLLGLLVGETITRDLMDGTMLVAGAITGFSAVSQEASRLLRQGRHGRAGLRVLVSWFTGSAAATAGVLLITS